MDQSHTIYLNNAATSFPKPKRVIEAISRSLLLPPSEPGRSHQQQDPTLPCRKRLALLFHVPTPSQVILTPSATIALNLVITGYLRQSPGGNCVTTRLEHNSVIRPLEHGSQRFGTRITYVSPEKNGRVLPATIQSSIDSNTRLIVVTHASNVTGCIQPVEEIAEIAATHKIPFLIDASQSAGSVELKYKQLPGQTYIAFAGIKGFSVLWEPAD